MKKELPIILIAFIFILSFFTPLTVSASTISEMNIYAIYLDSPEKGDCVLLESRRHALLIDIGRYSHAPTILNQLQTLGLTHVDICFSHLHSDHTGGTSGDFIAGLKFLINSGITVDNLYLPSRSYSAYSQRYQKKFDEIQNSVSAYTNIHYLRVNDQLTIGDITGKVIGPVNPVDYMPHIDSNGNGYTTYENNTSLAMIFSCGNTRYFTAGDCYKDEAEALCNYYGDALKCDIMKLCHHGTTSGNTQRLINAVQPKYSFASNIYYDDKAEDTGYWKIYKASTRASKYGMCYAVGTEKKTLIYHIVNDKITLYKGSQISSNNQLKGWQHFFGSDGVNMNYNTYYFDKNCQPLIGTQKIGKHYYFFDKTGLMQYGKFTSNNTYNHWLTSQEGKQYYTLTNDRKYAYLTVGFKEIDNSLYYFNSNGYLYIDPSYANDETDEDDMIITQIGADYYAMNSIGTLLSDDWLEQDGFYYFFKKDGKMVYDCLYTIENTSYLFDTDGTLMTADGVKYDFVSWKKRLYAVDHNGIIVKQNIVKIKGHKYYFDSNGVLVKNRKVVWKGHKYKCNSKGIVKKL